MSEDAARGTDDAISEFLESNQVSEAIEALEAVRRAKQASKSSPHDVLKALEVQRTLEDSSAVKKWQAVHDEVAALAELAAVGVGGNERADGSVINIEEQTSTGTISIFRCMRDTASDMQYPADVAKSLEILAARVRTRLENDQRHYENIAILLRHDRFVSACHTATSKDTDPTESRFIALDLPINDEDGINPF